MHDLLPLLATHVRDDPEERRFLQGWPCKPLALLATSFDEVIGSRPLSLFTKPPPSSPVGMPSLPSQVLLADHDAVFLSDPTDLFVSSVFRQTGMLMFHDRQQLQLGSCAAACTQSVLSGAVAPDLITNICCPSGNVRRYSPVKRPSAYVRRLIQMRSLSATFLRDHPLAKSQAQMEWPWTPSPSLEESPMANGLSNHHIDSRCTSPPHD